MSGPRSWAEVRKKALDRVERLKDNLVMAEAARVRDLQIEIRTIRQFIDWFENGAQAEDMMIGDPQPTDTNPSAAGGY